MRGRVPRDPPLTGRAADRWERYASLANTGRRKAGLAELDGLLADLRETERRDLAWWFCRRKFRGELDAVSAAFPFYRDVVLPVLLDGARRGDPTALRYLVFLAWEPEAILHVACPWLGERSHAAGLRAATLARNPQDARLWRHLFHEALDDADWGAHHMDEGILVLPLADCLAALETARALLARAPTGALDAGDRAELDFFEGQYADFAAWTADPEGLSFPAWCAARDRPYGWATHHYYEP